MDKNISGYLVLAVILVSMVVAQLAADKKYREETGTKPEYFWRAEKGGKNG